MITAWFPGGGFGSCPVPPRADDLVAVTYALRSISNTRNSVSSDIQTPRSGLKNEAQPFFFFFHPLQGFWIPDETLFRVFDIASKLIAKCGENEVIKSPKPMQIKTGYQNLLVGSDFLWVLVMNY